MRVSELLATKFIEKFLAYQNLPALMALSDALSKCGYTIAYPPHIRPQAPGNRNLMPPLLGVAAQMHAVCVPVSDSQSHFHSHHSLASVAEEVVVAANAAVSNVIGVISTELAMVCLPN